MEKLLKDEIKIMFPRVKVSWDITGVGFSENHLNIILGFKGY